VASIGALALALMGVEPLPIRLLILILPPRWAVTRSAEEVTPGSVPTVTGGAPIELYQLVA
jgi:hypothetical protein